MFLKNLFYHFYPFNLLTGVFSSCIIKTKSNFIEELIQKMKSKFLKILAIATTVFTLSAFTACGGNGTDGTNGSDSSNPPTSDSTPAPDLNASQGLTFMQTQDWTENGMVDIAILSGIGTCTDTEIIVPASYNNLPVRGTLGSAFSQNANITSIVFPEGFRFIEERTFYQCANLTTVVLPESLTTIYSYAFTGCPKLTNVVLPQNLSSIGIEAFNSCNSLTEIRIPDNVNIGTRAFLACTGLQTVVFGNGINVGESSFSHCTALTEIDLSGVTHISNDAFFGCTGFTKIVIPESVRYIKENAFTNCTNLTSISFNITEGWYRTNQGGATSGADADLSNPTENVSKFTKSTTSKFFYARNVEV